MPSRRRNRLEVPGSMTLMDQLKNEVAEELGIHNYDQLDKGDLPARVHGKIGGLMVRKMIEYAETHMASDGQAAVAEVISERGANEGDKEVVQSYMSQYPVNGGGQQLQ